MKDIFNVLYFFITSFLILFWILGGIIALLFEVSSSNVVDYNNYEIIISYLKYFIILYLLFKSQYIVRKNDNGNREQYIIALILLSLAVIIFALM